jgi:general secretion pathway protein B
MSYILDALKKSQQDRQQSNAPTLQSLQQGVSPTTKKSLPLIWPVAALTVVVLLLLVAYLMGLTANHRTVVINDAEQGIEFPTDSKMAPGVAATVQASPSMAAGTSAMAVSNTVLELWELPDPVQAEIPALTFSFHVYSDNPARRTIIINGRRLKEGGNVAQGLDLLEITQTGVVLRWNNHQFRIPVVENW